MKKKIYWLSFAVSTLLWTACSNGKQIPITFSVKNDLAIARKAETISLPLKGIKDAMRDLPMSKLVIKEVETGNVQMSQLLDHEGDGIMDEILFQLSLGPEEEKLFRLEENHEELSMAETEVGTFSRFVPERTDDYAWENDLVAFRTYGPEAQHLFEANRKGGTLSSGMDAWLKRVNYKIIDKWYEKHLEKAGSYHQDTGEGYDPYHVGVSRGIGGFGVWINDSLYTSKNFIEYKRLATGPIRTVFELTYGSWEAAGILIKEKKIISLDLGSNLSRFEVRIESEQELPHGTIGITLHDKTGKVKAAVEEGWFRYWEIIDGHQLGTGIVVDPGNVLGFKDYRSPAKDHSHLLVHTLPLENRIIYYAGFGWEKGGQFTSVLEWDNYLRDFSSKLQSPLTITYLD